MPKDEFDFADPLELNGVALATNEDTTGVMCECFIEEFMRLGYNAKQVLALFRNPAYLGMNLVLERRGEQYVRDQIALIYARWGRGVAGAASGAPGADVAPERAEAPDGGPAEAAPAGARQLDPMGNPAPQFHV